MHPREDQIVELEADADPNYDSDELNPLASARMTSSQHYHSQSLPSLTSSTAGLYNSQGLPVDPQVMRSGMFGRKYWSIHAMDKTKKMKVEKSDNSIFGKGNHSYSKGNLFYVIFFGWWLALVFLIAAALLYLTVFARSYGKLCLQLSRYIFWPFGKFIVHSASNREQDSLTESVSLSPSERSGLISLKPIQSTGPDYIMWMIIYIIVVLPFMLFATLIYWLSVLLVPMAKVNWLLLRLLYTQPMFITFTTDYMAASSHPLLLCTYRAFSKRYLSYSFFGVNIFFVNCVPIVLIRAILLLVQIATGHHFFAPLAGFFFDLFCAIPITFFIGLSISCITIQTNYMIGALLNASFGSLTELILFTLAIRKGELNDLILYSLTGGLLNDMLLIPGLSMIAGGIKYKQQSFNPVATGVGSLLFFVAIIGAFSPSIFYKAFGSYTQTCTGCVDVIINGTLSQTCNQCRYVQVSMDQDPIFIHGVAYLIYVVTALLPIAYIIGLIFTFRTHSHIFQEEEEGEGEDAPEWSIPVSVGVMVVSVLIFGLIAEDIVEIVQSVLEELGVEQSFLGVTLIALTPAATEIANAVRFALVNQISLSVQIGAASAVQVALVQMPCLTIIALIASNADNAFHLIFPNLSIFAVTLSVFCFTYISTDGNTNYFVGCVLVIMYLLLISAFYWVPSSSGHMVPTPEPAPGPAP